MHSQRPHQFIRPQRQAFSTAFLPVAAFIGITLAGGISAMAQMPYPVPVTDPLIFEYGRQLPPLRGAAVNGGIPTMEAAPAGEGGWLTAWAEQPYPSIVAAGDLALKARVLPQSQEPTVENPSGGGGELPAVTGAGIVERRDAFRTTAGPDGAWLTWQESGGILTRWFDGKTGASAGLPLRLNPAGTPATLVSAAGDGTNTWVVWTTRVEGVGDVASGAVLEIQAGATRVKAEFTLPTPFVPEPMSAANRGFGLFRSRISYTPEETITTVTVAADGTVGELRAVGLGFGGQDWMGIIPYLSGFYAVWFQYYSTGPVLLFQGRELSTDGGWAGNSSARTMGPVPLESGEGLRFFGGPSGAIVYSKSPGVTQGWLLSPGIPPQPVSNDFSGPWLDGRRSYSLGVFPRILALDTGDNRDTLTARRITQSGLQATTTAVSEGIGQQSALSLGWSRLGLQAVFQTEGYNPPWAAGPVTGYNRRPGALGGEVTYAGFTSPAQAWGWGWRRQLVAYRRRGSPETAAVTGDDDVMGVINELGEDGSLTPVVPPFVIAGGPSSQRGVAVSDYDGFRFLAAWREETGSIGDGTYVASVRAAYITDDGTVSPPGGRVLDISTREISAVSVVGSGYSSEVVWKVPQSANPKRNEIRMVSVPMITTGSQPQVITVSPASHDAVGPQVMRLGGGFCVVWRDKKTDRIYASPNGLTPGEPIAVSPVGRMAREPALASAYGGVAILWLEEGLYPVRRVMMSVMDPTGQITPPVEVASGNFDPDLLTASGGPYQVAFGVRDSSSAADGLRIFITTPEISRQGGLKLDIAGMGSAVSWSTSLVFPGVPETVETSADLRTWTAVPDAPQVISDSSGRSTLTLPMPAGEPRRYFRLRAVLGSGQ